MKQKIILSIILIISIQIGLSSQQGVDCITTPTDPSCANYVYPASSATSDINGLCKGMPYMTVCSLQKACNESSLSTGICQPFSLLAQSCTEDMGGMSDCKNFKSLCTTSGSVVSSCNSTQFIANLPTTKTINTQVKSICGEMNMEDCQKCPNSNGMGYLQCDIFDVYSLLCMAMPDMSQCSTWQSMCVASSPMAQSELSTTFCQLPVAEQTPLMRMFFHTGILDYVLFKTWIPRTPRQFAGAWFAIFFFAIIFECEKTLRSILEKKWEKERLEANEKDDKNSLIINGTIFKGSYPSFSYRDIVKGFLHGLELTMSYLLMLVAMTFNVALFFSVIAGTIFGYILVGRFRSYKPKDSCCD
ncbi:hypothetical protein CYY_007430 [Polysphondylium violaceum]|uniref:Copper transport protein n=1 Tax=Polysphondylium violaceum TaxID=133409 RepID=A0A8J4UY12_9MYCE|nr:hypothetical protein CYY_007430 [Polysphondylium violaceum]